MRSGRSVGWGLVVLGLLASSGVSRAEEWVELGSRRVAEGAEKDTIPVAAAQAGTGRFDAIKLEVQERGIELLDLEVHFGNGERQDVAVRAQFRPGESTRVIDLERSDRVIERVVLVYRARGRRDGAPIVRVLGRRAGAAAPAERWEDLGERVVDFGAERDTIPVTAREGRFRRIRLEVTDNGVEVLDLDVRFVDGSKQDVAVREHIAAGGRTRAIDLEGAARAIQHVGITYRTRGARQGKARVKLQGLQAEGAAAAPAAPRGGEPRWELLGRREVAFRAEQDTIPVTASEGRFRRLRLEVEGNAIEVIDLRVTFGNGDEQDVQVRERIAAGGSTRAIDLPGEARVIRSVRLRYKTEGRDARGRATVRLFGAD